VSAQRRERLGGQVLQPGAVVDQQGLAEDAAQPVLDPQRVLVAPLVEDAGGLADRRLGRVLAEDQAGQVQPVEVAQVVEPGEPAEQVAEGDQERPHRLLGGQRPRCQELPGAGPA
jgi:hypothetical protein